MPPRVIRALEGDGGELVTDVGLVYRHRSPDPLERPSERAERGLVSDREHDQVVTAVDPRFERPSSSTGERCNSVTSLRDLGTGWEIGAHDDVQLLHGDHPWRLSAGVEHHAGIEPATFQIITLDALPTELAVRLEGLGRFDLPTSRGQTRALSC